MKTILGLFDRYPDAERAMDEFKKAGVPRSAISVIAQDQALRKHMEARGVNRAGNAARRMLIGLVVGAVLGALVTLSAALWLLSLPVGETIVLAGVSTTVSAMTGAGAGSGAIIGLIIGLVLAVRTPRQNSYFYAEGLKPEEVMLAVRVGDKRAVEVLSIMRQMTPPEMAPQRTRQAKTPLLPNNSRPALEESLDPEEHYALARPSHN
jgi:hypothetical protein